MSRSVGESEIAGFGVQVTQLPTFKAMRLFNRLCRIAVPGLARAFSGRDVSLRGLLESSVGVLVAGAAEILERLTPDEQESILREVLNNARVRPPGSGEWVPLLPVFDEVFRGRVDVAYQIAWFALSVNFESFSDALKAAISAAEAKRAADGPRPTSPH